MDVPTNFSNTQNMTSKDCDTTCMLPAQEDLNRVPCSRAAIASPLLRLPAELRNEVWTLLYSNITINVNNQGRKKQWSRTPTRLNYQICGAEKGTVCRHLHPDVGCINNPDWDHAYNQYYGKWLQCNYSSVFTHPLVCKQFWAETTDVLYMSSTWVFHSQHDFRHLLTLNQASIQHIRRLVIRAPMTYNLGAFCNQWEGALTWRFMRRFERLQGVRIFVELHFDCNEDKTHACLSTDLLGHKIWKKMKLPSLLRALRQHKLRGEYTSVEMTVNESRIRYKLEDVDAWCNAMRALLLEHLPLGEGPSVSERRKMKRETKHNTERAMS